MNPITLTIDGRPACVPPGTTILSAARSLGISIPTLCYVEGFEHSASCFVCAVKLEGRPNLWPSCATPVAEGMKVITGSEEVRAARKTSLELLLSDHAGDCIGPCRTGCPAQLDIPAFIAGIAAGDHRKAKEIVTDDLTLPASLGRVCPRLCEQRCRQCDVTEALSIRNLHRFAAEAGRNVSSKSEGRSPKAERNPNAENRSREAAQRRDGSGTVRSSDFGLLSDFGLRTSDLGLRISRRSQSQFQLRPCRPAKVGGGQLRFPVRPAGLSARNVNQARDLLGEDALAGHAQTELGVVELAPAQCAQTSQHLVLFLRQMPRQPLLEQRGDRVG
jgi:ferredoxin